MGEKTHPYPIPLNSILLSVSEKVNYLLKYIICEYYRILCAALLAEESLFSYLKPPKSKYFSNLNDLTPSFSPFSLAAPPLPKNTPVSAGVSKLIVQRWRRPGGGARGGGEGWEEEGWGSKGGRVLQFLDLPSHSTGVKQALLVKSSYA